MRAKVFIDGQAGTTGLSIRQRLASRDEIELLSIDDAQRKSAAARSELLQEADVAILCLPDEAAREAAALVKSGSTRLLDASTAHRVDEDWVYGLPELVAGQRERIAAARRVSNPGCYPTGSTLLLRPLVDEGLVPADAALTIHALSGYSGGGRSLIERWEDPSLGLLHLVYEAPYALDRVHKHVPEMTRYARLDRAPQFVPAVGPFRCGMRVEIPLHAAVLAGQGNGKAFWEVLHERYRDELFVRVQPIPEPLGDERSLDPTACNETNRIDLHVLPNPAGHVLLVATLDNLGKGAGGMAVQNLNLMLGLDEASGLRA